MPVKALPPGTVEFADLTGYLHASVTAAGGQTFIDAFPGIDLTIEASGSFKVPTTYNTIGLARVMTSVDTGSNQFDVSISGDFGSSILFVGALTTDIHEIFDVTSTTALLSYEHMTGMAPTVVGEGTTSISTRGTGEFINPVTGAADGRIVFSQPDNFRIDYTGLTNNKFEFFRIGRLIPVPEPGFCPLTMTGLMLLVSRRRRRSARIFPKVGRRPQPCRNSTSASLVKTRSAFWPARHGRRLLVRPTWL